MNKPLQSFFIIEAVFLSKTKPLQKIKESINQDYVHFHAVYDIIYKGSALATALL
jgi:hypothetical protein